MVQLWIRNALELISGCGVSVWIGNLPSYGYDGIPIDVQIFHSREKRMRNFPGLLGTPGFPACRKRLFTMANFMDLVDDVLPGLVDKLSMGPGPTHLC